MRRSLTLVDRDMLVADEDRLRGYAIAQPCAPLLVPLAHEVSGVGVIDDFYDRVFPTLGSVTKRRPGAAVRSPPAINHRVPGTRARSSLATARKYS